ncbi:TonB-dependent receptor [Marinilabilia rubra]|uniref:TonB-dependent receptor n=1 Tax=Marinilabilia rubra TaxID=2162893 RepID=A0A2U2B438_9BACT|nr:TonB-dependent receptor [Marinilabilia rubra]PWD97826.1 TonB-dependent receptor [Marinilabilia rubra]
MNRVVFLFVYLLIVSSVFSQEPFQIVRGVVKDASSRETLPGANVLLREKGMGTITNMEGHFEFSEVPVGRYTLEVRFVGYNPAVIPEIVVGSGKEVVLNIDMEERVSQIEEVVVKSSFRKDRPINSMASVSARTFSVEEARRYAGSLDDPGRMAGNFAGVTTAGINVNAIVVRGNAPKGLLWRLEGIDIPVPSHFAGSNVAGGGGLTMFSSQVLANSDFYTGAFPAEYGNGTAGVFDMKLRSGNNRSFEYSGQVGVQGIEAAAEGPLKKDGQGSFLFNYRYSTMALVFKFLPETKEMNEIPVYQDLSFKLNLPSPNGGTFSLWGIGGLSKSTSDGFDEAEKWEFPENRQKMRFEYNMGAGGITYKKSLSGQTFLRSTIAANAGQHLYSEKLRLDKENPSELSPKLFVENIEGKVTWSSLVTHKYNASLNLRGGFDANSLFYDLTGKARNIESGSFDHFLEGDGETWLMEGHLQGKYNFSDGFYMTAGVNASWFQVTDDFRLEPRLSMGMNLNPQHFISFGYGNHSQTEPLFIYYVTNGNEAADESIRPNKTLKRMGAHHFVIGYNWSPTNYFRVKVEPYYQALYDVPVVAKSPYSMLNFRSDWSFDRKLVNEGTGKNIGVDVTIERFLKNGYYYMVTGSVYDSKYKGGDDVERRTRYDGGYVLNLLGGKEWKVRNRNLLGANLKITMRGPYWFHPVDEEATHMAKEVIYDEHKPFVDRYSNLEAITDFTLTYRVNGKKTSSVLALQIKNIAGRQYQGKRYNLQKELVENEFFDSAIPFISYKIEF